MAAKSAPGDPAWAFYYANSLRASNPEQWRELSLDVARRFPSSERGAQALYWLGYESEDPEARVRYLEQLRDSLPPAKFNGAENGMETLFDLYSRRDAGKALGLAEEMAKLFPTGPDAKTWQSFAAYARDMVQAGRLLKDEKAADALALLEKTASPRFLDLTPLHLAKAGAAGAFGDTQKAYDGLLRVMGGTPTDAVRDALLDYGARVGRDRDQVTADVRRLLESKATPANEFSLPRYGDEKKLSLADYRGKIVLLNFWYAFCGPCRGEFPYLQKILDKFAVQGFVVLSVNVHPEEEQFVLPYFRGNRFGFIPVRGDSELASRDWNARGFPSNFLIDQQGQAIYKPGVIRSVDHQAEMELQIRSLLAR